MVEATLAHMLGVQDHGMAATTRHFPGEGHDRHHQLLTKVVTPLSMDAWWQSKLGFDGFIVSDAVNMGRILGFAPMPEASARFIAAGGSRAGP